MSLPGRGLISASWSAYRNTNGVPSPEVSAGSRNEEAIDETDAPGAVVDADRWCIAAPPVVQRVAQGRQGQRLLGLPRHGLFAAGSHEAHGAIFEHQDGVAARDLPLAVRPIARERVSNL